MCRIVHVLVAILWTLAPSSSPCIQDNGKKRVPVPSQASQKEAEQLIREVFSEQYNKNSAADRISLARTLIQQAGESEDDTTTQYVLLREAADLAARAGAGETAFRAIRIMENKFTIDLVAVKSSTLSTLGKFAHSHAERRAVARSYLELAEDAARTDAYDRAASAADAAASFALASKDIALAARSRSKAEEFTTLNGLYVKVKSARQQLLTDPMKGSPNLVVGRFLCMLRGRWEEGLPYLARGNNATLKSLALRELSKPGLSGEQSALADAWWRVGETEKGFARKNIRAHAASWYERSLARVSGASGRGVKGPEARHEGKNEKDGWVDLTDATLFDLRGERGKPIKIVPDAEAASQSAAAWLKRLPRGTFDAVSARVRFGPKRKANGGFLLEDNQRMVYFSSSNDSLLSARFDRTGKRWIADLQVKCPRRDEYEIKVVVADGAYVVYVDGEEKMQIKTNARHVTTLGLQATFGPVTFDLIRLRKAEE